jgi:ribonucleoside-diphosphate reductase alpha chain
VNPIWDAALGDRPERHQVVLTPWAQESTEELIRHAIEQTSLEDPAWIYTAAALLREHLYRQVPGGYAHFRDHVTTLVRAGLYHPSLVTAYRPEELDAAGQWLKPERDRLFHYAGLKSLADRYLVRAQGRLQELPQHRFLVIALFLAQVYGDHKLAWAYRFYEALSQLQITVATPVLANAGRAVPQLASCFVDTVEDDLASIYRTNAAFAQVSKWGGGMGIYLGHIRSRGATIRGIDGAAGGVISWVKNYNNTAVTVDQLGVRAGAVTVWLDMWHKDILDFLDLRTNNGDQRLKAYDVFPGVSIPDAFMRAVAQRASWFLFDPHEIWEQRGWRLEDFWGTEWEARYQALVRDPAISRREIPARELMKRLLKSAYETGTPFVFFRDAVNRANPNKHAGMIYASNLCTEIAQNMSPTRLVDERLEADGRIVSTLASGDFVVCNLASLNLGRLPTRPARLRASRLAVRMMDAVVDLNAYPVPAAQYTAHRYRAVGLGVSGYHQRLALDHIVWESPEHVQAADRWFEEIAYAAITESVALAREKGPYPLFAGSDWQSGAVFRDRGYTGRHWERLAAQVATAGLRNGYLLAVAPTSSTSLIAGSTAGIDPVFEKFYWEEKKGGLMPQVAPDLSPETQWYYKAAHTLDQQWSLQAAAARQRHIDQSQSLNLYVTPTLSAATLLEYYLSAWRLGLKTVYYLRNRSLDVEECVSCSG